MGNWLRGALTPPKWLRDSTGLSTSSLLNIVSPSGTLNQLRNSIPKGSASQPKPQAQVLSSQEVASQNGLMLVGGVVILYLLVK
tara:strand:+ start:318 stop:569 length:252 start_codon:yes stop_codon:yes gene_type:complete